jgi:enediyne biosynthesis protein E4
MRTGGRLGAVFLAAGISTAAAPAPPSAPVAPEVLWKDVTAQTGITFTHHSAPEKKYIVESMSGGVALFDYDNDGKLDIYLVDSLTVDTARETSASHSALYRNKGDGTYESVGGKAGVEHAGWAMGVCAADLDSDGWVDLYVTAFEKNHLYRNNHDGTFTDIAAASGVVGGGWSTGCAFGDYDRDGDLDLFISRYVKVDLDHLPEFGSAKTCEYRGIAVQCGPRGLPGEGDLLYRNDGKGKFTEVGVAAGVADPKGYFGLGAAWFDGNGDGWPDLYVANDSTPSFYYVNQKDGTFKESAFPMGVAVSEDGSEQGGMGVAIGDYLGTGRLSIFKTNFSEEYNNLYRNDGDHFTDVSFRAGVAASSLPYVGWGTAFVDYDNDGWQDILVVNGHVYPQLDKARLGASAPYRQRKLLYRNKGDGTFDEVSARYGPVLMDPRVQRGMAIGDLDNDGRVDVVVNDLDGGPQVMRNEMSGTGHWLIVKLAGRAPNMSAIGAVVTLKAGALTQKRLVRSGTGYISQDDLRPHFGLGASAQADWVEVLWPDQTTTRVEKVKADQIVEIKQDAPAKP